MASSAASRLTTSSSAGCHRTGCRSWGRATGSGRSTWSGRSRWVRVLEPLVMLAEEILAVVVAVRRSNHGMNVVARRLVVVEGDPGLVVEFHQDDRTVHPVIEDAVLLAAAHPGEMG